MPKTLQIKTRVTVETLVDPVKDEIDHLLHSIRSPKRRLEAARDLIDYLQLHYVD
jgi:hypothetical protein